MKRVALIALLAIAILGLGAPVTAHAHDGPVMVAVFDAAAPLAVDASALPAANYIDSSTLLPQAGDFTPDLDYTGEAAAGNVGAERSEPYRESEHRARDVQAGDHARG